MTRVTLPDFIAAIQNLLTHQNQYITNPSKRPTLIAGLREAASNADKIADRYQRDCLEGNDDPTPADHAGRILWNKYKAAREAFHTYKAQTNSSNRIALKQAEFALKQYTPKLLANLHNLKP